MPTGPPKQDGEHAMSNAERQARYRARHTANPSPIASRPRCIPDPDAVAPSVPGKTQSTN